jgi:hypothetical protein
MRSTAPLRPKEQVIEEFGVSIKYTILLGIVGGIILSLVLFFRFVRGVDFIAATQMLGILGPFALNATTIVVGLIGLYLIVFGLFLRISYHYYLTTERVISSIGFFSQRIVSAEYKTVSDLIIRQDAISHFLLGTGTLGVNTFGGQPEEVELANIDNPTSYREHLRGLAEAVQEGRTVTSGLLRDLKSQRGMLASNDMKEGEQLEARKNSIEAPGLPVSINNNKPPLLRNEPLVEDLEGDIIQESDRLRAAQKKLNP